jgi:hypothetical protein
MYVEGCPLHCNCGGELWDDVGIKNMASLFLQSKLSSSLATLFKLVYLGINQTKKHEVALAAKIQNWTSLGIIR